MKFLKTLYPVLIPFITFGFLTGCDFNSPGPEDHEEPQNERYEGLITDFQGPTYSDDYTGIMSWSDRYIWNLANVHDPTVIKDGDYFYMYQTNASYGNVHDAGGNFPARCSKDLVNWEYLGDVFDSDPLSPVGTVNFLTYIHHSRHTHGA